MRNLKPDTIQEAVRASIKAAGGLEAASNDLSLSVSSLSRASGYDDDRPGGLGVNYLHTLGRVVPASAEPIAVHFARLAGGVFQPLPDSELSLANINTVMREFTDVLDVHAHAHSERSENPDGYTQDEARRALKETDELLRAVLIWRAALAEKIG